MRPDLGVFVVADGMGGHPGGDVASRIVVNSLERFFERMGESDSSFDDDEQRVDLAIRMCQREVARHAIGELAPMGTTVALMLVRQGVAILCHVGDSRIYRFRDGIAEQMTRDHSLTAKLEAADGKHVARQLCGTYATMVTRSIGVEANAKPDICIERVEKGDRYLLCTDGLSDVLDAAAITDVLCTWDDPEKACCWLVQRAYKAGSMDNITALVVDPA